MIRIHELPVWQDPNSFLIVEFIREELFCYFKCLNREQSKKSNQHIEDDFLGVLRAHNLLEIKHKRYTKLTLYPTTFEHNYDSYYYEIENSTWLNDVLNNRTKEDPDWKKHDTNNYKHFVLENSKYWIEIIATKITFNTIERKEDKLILWDTI